MTGLFKENLPEARRPLRELPPGWLKVPEWKPPEQLPSLKGVKRIAIDTENKDTDLNDLGPGVRRPGNYIAGLSLAIDGGPSMYLPVRHQGGGNLDENMVKSWARSELNNFKGEVVGARLIYDLEWLTTWGVHFPKETRFLDIQNAEALLDENRLRYGLEFIAQDYLGVGKNEALLRLVATAYRWKTQKDVKSRLWQMPAHLVASYAIPDAELPLAILPLQLKKIADEELTTIWEIESRLIPLLLAMRLRGVRVDTRRAETLRVALSARMKDAEAALHRIAGPKASFRQPNTLGPALEAAGIKVPRTEKTNAYSVTKELLEKHAELPLCKVIRQGRQLDTIITTFLDGHVFTHAVNGRIHCEFNQLKRDDAGTIARFSSSNPNLQNIPARDDELAPLVRGLFIPEDGSEWRRHDLSQIEYRFLAHYAVGVSGEAARRAYQADPKLSFHIMCAQMFGLEKPTGERYKRIKNTNFCKVYGGGIPKLAATFNCSLEEAAKFNSEYEQKLPFVTATFEAAEELGQARGFVKTILKRRRRFPYWVPAYQETDANGKKKYYEPLPLDQARARYKGRLKRDGARNSLSGLLQGGAADFMKKAMVDQWEAGVCDVLGAPLLTVHDELDWDVPKTEAGQAAVREAKHLMDNAVKLRVPVFSEEGVGSNWGECK